jgi:hypothetical protein
MNSPTGYGDAPSAPLPWSPTCFILRRVKECVQEPDPMQVLEPLTVGDIRAQAGHFLYVFRVHNVRSLLRRRASLVDLAKLTRIMFHMLTIRQAYDEGVFAQPEQKHIQQMENRLGIQAQTLGYQLLRAQGWLLSAAVEFLGGQPHSAARDHDAQWRPASALHLNCMTTQKIPWGLQ